MNRKIIIILAIIVISGGKAFPQRDSLYRGLITNKAAYDNIYKLDLSVMEEFNGVIPEEIKNYKNITSVDFGDLHVTIVPQWIGKLKSLKKLAFNNSFLECESQLLLQRLNIENPSELNGTGCYEKIAGIIQGRFIPDIVAYEEEGKLNVLNITTGQMLFNNITDFEITPCKTPILVKKDSLFIPNRSADDFIDRKDFLRYGFSYSIEKIELEHCESGSPNLITLTNDKEYYFDSWKGIIVEKGQKKIKYGDEKSDCEKILTQLETNVNGLKDKLETYYHYADCTEESLEKAESQVEKVNHYGNYYKWDFEGQDIAPKNVTMYPAEQTAEKSAECNELLVSWMKQNPGVKKIPLSLMVELEQKGCIHIQIKD